jgi:soluble lytic murein transglycosylase
VRTILCLLALSVTAHAQHDFFAKIRALKSEKKFEQAAILVDQQIDQISNKGVPAKDVSTSNNLHLLTMEKGLLARDLGNLEKAQSVFSSLMNPNNEMSENALYELAQIDLKQNKSEQASEHLKSLLALSPNLRMQSEAEFQIAKIDIDNRKLKNAKSVLQKLERRNKHEEKYPEILYQLAREEQMSGNQPGMCKWVRKLYAHYPDFARISTWGFRLSDDTIEDRPSRCQASSEDKKSRIKNLQWAGMSTKAAAEIQELKNGSTGDAIEASRLEVAYLLHEGDADKAMGILLPQYDSRKNDPAFLTLLASAATKLGDPETAVGSYYGAYRRSPRSKAGRQALYQAAFLSYQFQDYDGAARKFQEFMKLYPGSGLSRDAKWHLAWIRYLRGDYPGSFKSMSDLLLEVHKSKKAAKAFPSDRVNYWMGMSLYRLGRLPEARIVFDRLRQDKLVGFYALAAQARLHKIDEVLPKSPTHVLPDENMRMTRFNPMEALMPADDPSWFRNVANQSIENVVDATADANAADKSVSEESENEQEVLNKDEGPDRGGDEVASATEAKEEEEPSANFTNPMMLKRFERARDLMAIGLQEWARWDLYDIEKRTSNKDFLKTLMQEYEIVESYNRSSYIGQVTFGTQRASFGMEGVRNLWEHAFPKAFANYVGKYSREFGVPSELIWGIMRAESQYKRDVISPVGALGLMQVMPFTAQKVATLLGEKEFDSKSLLQPEGAVRIGSKYLQRLLKKFDGNLALVAASYNAGPHRVRSWVGSFGQLDEDEFIEHIPYLETRNYVKKVLTNFATYSKLYGGKKEFMHVLSEPLHVQNMEPMKLKENGKENWDDI